MAVCSSSGFSGFPINPSGWTSIIDKSTYVINNDISLQFSPSDNQCGYNNGFCAVNNQNTFFMGGTQYAINRIRICSPGQNGLSTNTPIAELNIWGKPTAPSSSQQTIAVLNIPIFQGSVNSPAGVNFISYLNNQQIKLDSLIPKGNDVNVVRYNTCIETNMNNTINIVVGYWESGITIIQESRRLIPSPLVNFGVPKSLINPAKLLSSYALSATGKTSLVYTTNDPLDILIPYNSSITSPSDLTKIRYIKGFSDITSSKQSTNAYKCITINPSKDIKNGQILINPDTGKRLSEELADSQVENEMNIQVGSIGDTMEKIAIALGVCLGLLLLFVLFYYLAHIFITQKQVGVETPVPPVVEPV